MTPEPLFPFDPDADPPDQLDTMDSDPMYIEGQGAAIVGDSRDLLTELDDESVDLVVTSPPFALNRKKEYGNEDQDDYVDWFLPFAERVYRVLKPTGSFVIDIGGSWKKGRPIKSLYQSELLLCLAGPKGPFHLAQDFYWYNPAKLPTPAQWVTIERIRVKDAVNHVWWLSKDERPKADNTRVLKAYSDAQERLMEAGYRDKDRPSGHSISSSFDTPKEENGSIRPNFWNVLTSGDAPVEFTDLLCSAGVPDRLVEVADQNDLLQELIETVFGEHVQDNVIEVANTASKTQYLRACKELGLDPHPARFPRQLPEFFIKFLTEPGDLVVDIFAGSNTTGHVADELGRHWLAFDDQPTYLRTSQTRFRDWEEIEFLASIGEDHSKPAVGAGGD